MPGLTPARFLVRFATLHSLAAIGLILAAAFFAALFWLIASWGWIPLDSAATIAWVVAVMLATILAVDMSWSHVRRRPSGPAVTDVHDG